ncbi:ABC transporter substrate-binding protein [Specibacter cremeus]|uniref:ABC transporter substrate-binding protein n=1 Tax=Specibacter cremeus TaxID=1629051 RepID=UPI000F7884D7|nr:ABC transporter substrate-binding protein [Specibacter cremeus]
MSANQQGAESPDTLWYTHCPIPTPTSIAWQRGLFSDEFAAEGIEVKSLWQSDRREVRDSHYLHTQPNSFRHGGNLPPLLARSRGSDVRLLGMTWAGVRNAILTLPGSGIASAEDLRGRRLSVPRRPRAAFDFWHAHVLRTYEGALAAVGLSLDDVRLVEVVVDEDESGEALTRSVSLSDTARRLARRHREEVIALVAGRIDVIATEGQTAVTIQDVLGLDVVTDLFDLENPADRVNNTMPTALTVSGALLDARPDLVERWLAVVLRAGEWARDHEREAKRIAALECGIHEDHVERAFSATMHEHLGVDLEDASLAALEAQHDFLLRHRIIDTPVDLRSFVVPEVLHAARARVPVAG